MQEMENTVDINIDLDGVQETPTFVDPEAPSIEETVKQQKAAPAAAPNSPSSETYSSSSGEQIGKIKSALFGGLTKILSFLSQGTGTQDIIYIKEGKLSLIKNAGFIYCDLSIMFENNDLELVDPTRSIKLLNLIKGGDEVLFIKDDENSRYLISNLIEGEPSTTITLPQPDRTVVQEVQPPELGELKYSQEIEIEVVDNIQQASKTLESQFLKIEIQKDDFKVISISTSDDIFKHQISQKNGETEIYKVFNPFPINKPDALYLEVHEDNLGKKWIRTISSTGMVNIEYSEVIETIGEFDTFML